MNNVLAIALLLLASTAPVYAAQEPNTAETCRSSWQDASRDSWRAKDYERAVEFFKRLQVSVARNERPAVAGMIAYPLRVSGEYRVHNRTAFLRNYSRIFDESVRHAVQKQVPECLFGNYQGFMAGNGAVWFEYSMDHPAFKVIAVNNESWPKPNEG